MLSSLQPAVRSHPLNRFAFGLLAVALVLVMSGSPTYGQSTDLDGEFTTYNSQIAQEDGVIDVNGTAVGKGGSSVVVAFVGQRGNTEAFKVSVDGDGTFSEQKLSLGSLNEGPASAHILSSGPDGTFGDDFGDEGDLVRSIRGTRSPDFTANTASGDQVRSRIIANTVDDTGSDDLIVTENFRLSGAMTSIEDIFPEGPRDGDAIESGETMVVEGLTNKRPGDNVITVEVLNPDDESLTLTSTDEWAENGQWSVKIRDTGFIEPGTYTVEADDGDDTDRVQVEIVAAVPDLTIIDGSAGGLDVTSDVSPGTSDNPVGLFALSAGQAGASFDEVTVTINPSGVSGISAARLYWSDDQNLDTGMNGDDQLGNDVSIDPSNAPSSITFTGFNKSIPTSTRYAILAIDVEDGATADVSFELADESDLSTPGGEIATVNGSSQSSFTALPLSNGSTALPVELASFDAQPSGSETVRLQWKTASETNNAGFRIEREDKTEGWTEIGFVESQVEGGTTTEAQSYRFTDTDVPYDADSLTYRLKQVDTDGSTSYTDPVTVARSAVEQVRLLGTHPNPARSRATAQFAVPEGAAGEGVRLRLYDALGRQVRTVEAPSAAGRHEVLLETSGLPSGVYFLRLTAGSTTKTQKLTVVQ
jgi:hypothetical protein